MSRPFGCHPNTCGLIAYMNIFKQRRPHSNQSAIKDLMLRRNKAQAKDTNIMLETFTKSCKFFLATLGSSVIGRGSRAAGCMWFPIKWAGSPYFMFMWLLLIQGELVYNISLHHGYGLGWGYKWAHYDDGYDDNLLGLCVWQYYRSICAMTPC